jgi:hypothetical protein
MVLFKKSAGCKATGISNNIKVTLMEEKIDFLIQTKNWNELTPDEKNLIVKELGSEAAFHAFKEVNAHLADSEKSKFSPDRSVLPALRSRMKQKHSPVPRLKKVLLFPIPGYAFVLFGLAMAFVFQSGGKHENDSHTTATLIKRDTVYVSSAPDTVYINRVVYKKVFVPQQPDVISVVNNDPQQQNTAIGVTVKEKEELNNLLVSGSE